MREHQLSRYGAIAKVYPLTTGKVYFLINSSEARAGELINTYVPDGDGTVRTHTTWASVITAIEENTGADVIIVSPLFTTAPTLAQIVSLNAAGVTVWQAGSNQPDGSYLVTKAATTLQTLSTSTLSLFQVNGRVEILDIFCEVASTLGTIANFAKFTNAPTVGSTSDMCATASIAALALGGTLTITGTPSAVLVATTHGAFARMANPLSLKAGTIALNVNQTTPGTVMAVARYKPIDPGAFISAL